MIKLKVDSHKTVFSASLGAFPEKDTWKLQKDTKC